MYLLPARSSRGRTLGMPPVAARRLRRRRAFPGLGMTIMAARNGEGGSAGVVRDWWQRRYIPRLPAATATASSQVTGAAVNAGTPVPSGFSTNQIFVNADGSQWVYSATQKKWLNVGTPYNVGATAVSAPSTTTTAATPSGTPVSAAAAPLGPAAAAASGGGYQAILDWLSQSSLISVVPNWTVALGAALLWAKFSAARGGR